MKKIKIILAITQIIIITAFILIINNYYTNKEKQRIVFVMQSFCEEHNLSCIEICIDAITTNQSLNCHQCEEDYVYCMTSINQFKDKVIYSKLGKGGKII